MQKSDVENYVFFSKQQGRKMIKNDEGIFWRKYINSRTGRTRKRWFDVDEEQRYSEVLSGRETMVYKGETGWNYVGGGGSVEG